MDCDEGVLVPSKMRTRFKNFSLPETKPQRSVTKSYKLFSFGLLSIIKNKTQTAVRKFNQLHLSQLFHFNWSAVTEAMGKLSKPHQKLLATSNGTATLGARGLSCAVSGCGLCGKPLVASAFGRRSPACGRYHPTLARKTSGTQGTVQHRAS